MKSSTSIPDKQEGEIGDDNPFTKNGPGQDSVRVHSIIGECLTLP